jgi:hypothetical protein
VERTAGGKIMPIENNYILAEQQYRIKENQEYPLEIIYHLLTVVGEVRIDDIDYIVFKANSETLPKTFMKNKAIVRRILAGTYKESEELGSTEYQLFPVSNCQLEKTVGE